MIVTLNTKAITPCTVTVLQMVREVTATSGTAVEVPMVKAK